MVVSFVRTGGLGGLRLAAELDTDTLPPADADELRGLVAAVLAAPAAPPAGGGRGADRFRYDLTVVRAGETRQLSLSDADLTPELRALVARLERRAKSRG